MSDSKRSAETIHSQCDHCEAAPATEKVQARLGDVAVGATLKLCKSCADEVTA